jgi:hypothetical protein
MFDRCKIFVWSTGVFSTHANRYEARGDRVYIFWNNFPWNSYMNAKENPL